MVTNYQLFTNISLQLSKSLTYQLFVLITGMSKAEKRHFKLYAKRNFTEKQTIVVKLFDVIDKMGTYKENKIAKAFPELKGNTLSNHKAGLYEQLLSSLRLLHHNDPAIRIKELISYADVLHMKGLYNQALIQLQKAKQQTDKHHLYLLKLEIIQTEKLIESRYITRSHSQRAAELIETSEQLYKNLYSEGLWLDLSLKMYDYYLKFGHIKNQDEFEQVSAYFTDNLPKEESVEPSFYYEIYKTQSFVWFNYITQNFVQCYKYSKYWVNHFENYQKAKTYDPELYMKGLHNGLASLFYCDDAIRFKREFKSLQNFIKENRGLFNENQDTLAFIYEETAKLNLFFLEGKYTEGAAYTTELVEKIRYYINRLDIHRVLIFYYKIACLKFGSGDIKGSIFYLNQIINHPSTSLREDIQCFSRILNLIAHYELGNQDLIEYQIKSTYRFLLKLKEVQKVQAAIFKFLKSLVYIDRDNLLESLRALKKELEMIMEDRYERRPNLYLDIVSWIESKIENKPVESIIRKKKLAGMKGR